MSQKACDQYLYDLTVDGTFIADTSYVTQVPTSRAVTIPISARTREKFGKELFSNIVALGVLVGTTGIVTKKAIKTAVLARFPEGTEKINEEALNFGFALAAEAKKNKTEAEEITADD